MQLARITVYPVKSLTGVELAAVAVGEQGALDWDRRFVVQTSDGGVVNGKREPMVHGITAAFDLLEEQIALQVNGFPDTDRFALHAGNNALDDWFSDYFAQHVKLVEYVEGGLPDDQDFPGPTIISRQTIAAVATWFNGMGYDAMRERLRANLELDAGEPFAEDALLNPDDSTFRFRLGAVAFNATHPCQRCVVPGRDPRSGIETANFAAEFTARRQQSLAGSDVAGRFDHFYRLSLNTRVAAGQAGTVLTLGDKLEISP